MKDHTRALQALIQKSSVMSQDNEPMFGKLLLDNMHDDSADSSLDLQHSDYLKFKALVESNQNYLTAAIHILKDVDQKIDLIKLAVDKGIDIHELLLNNRGVDIITLNSLSSFLLENSSYPMNPQKFLEVTLSKATRNLPELSLMKENLIEKCSKKGAVIENSLTIYHYEDHSFFSLSCEDCNRGKAANIYIGLYHCEQDEINVLVAESMRMVKKVADYFALGDYMPYTLVGNLFDMDLPSKKYCISQEFGGGMPMEGLYQTYNFPTYKELTQTTHKKFPIKQENAAKVYASIEAAVIGDPSLEYNLIGNNCIDFTQKHYEKAGLSGSHIDQLYESGYPLNLVGLYATVLDVAKAATEPHRVIQSINGNNQDNVINISNDTATAAALALVTGKMIYKAAKVIGKFFQADTSTRSPTATPTNSSTPSKRSR